MRYLIWVFMDDKIFKSLLLFRSIYNGCLSNNITYWTCIWNIPYICWCFVLKRMKCDSFTPSTCQNTGRQQTVTWRKYVSLTIRSFTVNSTNNSWKFKRFHVHKTVNYSHFECIDCSTRTNNISFTQQINLLWGH